MRKGERFTMAFWATVFGIIVLNLGGFAYDLLWRAFDRVEASTGWSAVGYGLASLGAVASFLVIANLIGFAFIYASRHIDAERKKDRPEAKSVK